MQMAYRQQQAIHAAQRKQAKPAPRAAAPGASPKAAVPGAPITDSPCPFPFFFRHLSGDLGGKSGAFEGKGICDLRFELRETSDEPGHFTGDSALTCRAYAPLVSQRPQQARPPHRSTASTRKPRYFSGTVEKGSFAIQADKVVGTDSSGCAPTSFSLTPFGAGQLASEWQEGTCAGGHMMLHKARP